MYRRVPSKQTRAIRLLRLAVIAAEKAQLWNKVAEVWLEVVKKAPDKQVLDGACTAVQRSLSRMHRFIERGDKYKELAEGLVS